MGPVAALAPAPPDVLFEGRLVTSEELAGLAAGWHALLADRVPPDAPVAGVLRNDPASVALLFALSARPGPLIHLPRAPGAWRTDPPVPAGTPLVLPPGLAGLAPEGERRGLRPLVLPERAAAPAGHPPFLGAGVLVGFTSGSTGPPRPVVRRLDRLLAAAAARAEACGLRPGARIVATGPLDRGMGVNTSVLLATALRGRLDLFPGFEPRALLARFAAEPADYWAATPAMADLLVRAAGGGPHPAPRHCMVGGWLSRELFDAFRRAFGVPPRGAYGATETGTVTADGAPDDEVRWGSVGRPLPGAEVRVGEDPGAPFPDGRPGPIWVRTPWMMAGYGFPPAVTPAPLRDGWFATADLGRLDPGHGLALAGRGDDCVRTPAGYTVNLAEIGLAALGHPGVRDAVAVPLDVGNGFHVGVLAEGDREVTADSLRRHLGRRLPPWSQPRVLEVTAALPRLAGGKPDRRTCADALRALLADGPAAAGKAAGP